MLKYFGGCIAARGAGVETGASLERRSLSDMQMAPNMQMKNMPPLAHATRNRSVLFSP
jgi:hypothetical protein